jgi:hypothetical protein
MNDLPVLELEGDIAPELLFGKSLYEGYCKFSIFRHLRPPTLRDEMFDGGLFQQNSPPNSDGGELSAGNETTYGPEGDTQKMGALLKVKKWGHR